MVVVEVIDASFYKDAHLIQLIHLLDFLTCYHNFWFYAYHFTGKDNNPADVLHKNHSSVSLTGIIYFHLVINNSLITTHPHGIDYMNIHQLDEVL